jgi:archaellum component FlaF (FlaF/FlaG flagellin family)
MTTIYKHILTATLLIAMLAMGIGAAINTASADTGPWQWSDISDKLSVRTNRPVWASAFAHPYWYLTDGQELYTGGHIWKTDGSVMTDITAEVRSAGLNRVDDIVTDGQTIMFLKNVVSKTNNYEVLTYKDGTWGYPAGTWRNNMNSNEAISSINGKDGVWMIVSTQGNLYRWTQSTNNFVNIALPSDIRNKLILTNIYQTNHGSVPGGLVAVPINNKWLVAVKTYNLDSTPGSSQLRFYSLDGTNFSEIKRTYGDNIFKIVSNGSEVFINTVSNYRVNYENVLIYRNNSFVSVVSMNANLRDLSDWSTDWNLQNALVAYNGKSWIIINHKKLRRFDGTNFQNYGETRDYFVTASGNGNGTLMVGGVVSALGNPNPTSPLTAKLVRVDEGTGYNTPSNPVVNTNNEVWASMTVGNNNHELYHGQSSNVNITGGSPNGIDRIEIWLNGNIVKTCYDNDCDYTIYGSSYTKGSALSFNGRVVDEQGHEAWTWLGEYYVPVDDYYTNNYNNNNYYNSDGRLSVWFDFSPSGNQMYGDDYKVIQAHANAQDGLKKLEIYVNDNLKRSCSFSTVYGDQNCNYSIYSNQYTSYDKIKVHVKAYDNYGRQIQTNTQYIYRDGYWDNNNNGNYDSSVAAWFDGNVSKTTLGRNESRNITFYGNANRGLEKLELYANNSIIGTCYFNGATGDKTCSKTIYGNNFNADQTVTLKIKATDRDGYQNWSSSINFRIEDDGSNNNNSNYINSWMWFEPSDTNFSDGENSTIKVQAAADNGLSKIEVYANNSLIKTCNYSRAYGTQNCEVTIYANNYNSNSTINIYSRATDYSGRTDVTDTMSLYRNGSNNNNNNGTEVYAWMWLDPSNTDLDQNETKTINVGASADSGLQKIEIYADGSLKKTCTYNRAYGNQECSVAVYGNNFSSNKNISIFARAYDYNGRMTQTNSQNVYVTGTDNNNNYQNDIIVWLGFDLNDTALENGGIWTFRGVASAEAGLDRIEVYVNDSLKRTCNFNRAYGSQTCQSTISANDFGSNDKIKLTVKAYDHNGYTDQFEMNINKVYDNNETNVNGSLTITSNHDSGYTNYDQITFTANGSDSNGINKIEILVNAQVVKTCNSASTCSYVGGPYNTQTVSYGANLYDNLGNRTWTGYKTIYKK